MENISEFEERSMENAVEYLRIRLEAKDDAMAKFYEESTQEKAHLYIMSHTYIISHTKLCPKMMLY